uniref:Uncharacterized protein n=1 Tax=Anopheles atroparvus TaxID=41427 RepID=A0AAG5D1L5_ANOAO
LLSSDSDASVCPLVFETLDRVNEDGKKIRRKCTNCNTRISSNKSRKDARKLGKQTYTYCGNCPGQPQMCRECFESIHNK